MTPIQTNIPLNSLSAKPSDLQAPDGDLALSLNIINEGAGLRPIVPPATLFSIPPGASVSLFLPDAETKLFCIWQQSDHQTVISFADYKGDPLPGSESIAVSDQIKQIRQLGNTLIATGLHALHYILWRPVPRRFDYLGTSLPRIDIDFALDLKLATRSSETSGKLIDASKIQPSEQSYSQIFQHGYSNLALSSSNFGSSTIAFRVATQAIQFSTDTDIILQKGKYYKFDSHVEGLNVRFLLCLFDHQQYDEIGTTNDYLAQSYEPITLIPKEDLPLTSLWFALIGRLPFDPGSRTISVSITIQEAEAAPLETIDGKVIPYSHETFTAVAAASTAFIAEQATNQNRFIFPFFIRYALRLYDGTYASISSPRLMIPNSDYVPWIFFRQAGDNRILLDTRALVATLLYRIPSLPDLSAWKDIISSIDIFVSPGAWPLDQSDEYDPERSAFDFFNFNSETTFGIGRLESTEFFTHVDLNRTISRLADTTTYSPFAIAFGRRTQEEFFNQFTSASMANFYQILTLEIDKLYSSPDFIQPEIPDGALSSLLARPTLTQSALNYAGFADASAYIYNSRLHLFNATPILPSPEKLPALNPFTDYSIGNADLMQTFVTLNTATGQQVISVDSAGPYNPSDFFWAFYPDSRAVSLTFAVRNDSSDGTWRRIWEIPLTPHPFLNGAYALVSDFNSRFQSQETEDFQPPVQTNQIGENSALSTIYISEAGNPFIFPASSAVSLGVRRVTALASAARPLSEGQFGQFPLYAFTDSGIWALEINTAGTYSARQPIVRDVCTNPEAITPIDSAVLFPSSRGIMLLSGSQTQCISDTIDEPNPLSLDQLPGLATVVDSLPDIQISESFPVIPFSDFIKSCRIIYDYSAQRIYICNPGYGYSYVYSLRSHFWATTTLILCESIPAYPEALAVDAGNHIVDFALSEINNPEGSNNTEQIPALIASRPLTLGQPEILKTLRSLIVRGAFPEGSVRIIVYGSRNLIHWYPVASSLSSRILTAGGTPYRYFRLVILADIRRDNFLSHASVSYLPRFTSHPRG